MHVSESAMMRETGSCACVSVYAWCVRHLDPMQEYYDASDSEYYWLQNFNCKTIIEVRDNIIS